MANGICVCVPAIHGELQTCSLEGDVCVHVCLCERSSLSVGHPRLSLIKAAATGSPWLGWQTYRVSTQRAHPHLPGSPWVAHHDTKTNAARFIFGLHWCVFFFIWGEIMYLLLFWCLKVLCMKFSTYAFQSTTVVVTELRCYEII